MVQVVPLLSDLDYLGTCDHRRKVPVAELPDFPAAKFHVFPPDLCREEEVVRVEVDALDAVAGRVRVADQLARRVRSRNVLKETNKP